MESQKFYGKSVAVFSSGDFYSVCSPVLGSKRFELFVFCCLLSAMFLILRSKQFNLMLMYLRRYIHNQRVTSRVCVYINETHLISLSIYISIYIYKSTYTNFISINGVYSLGQQILHHMYMMKNDSMSSC